MSSEVSTRFRCDRVRSVRLKGVVTLAELSGILAKARQPEWRTRVRLGGLLLLIDYVVRNRTSKGVSISAELAHDFVSALRRTKLDSTIKEPLALLCGVGILKCVQAAVNGQHVKMSALYALHGAYAKRSLPLKVDLPLYLAKKRESAPERKEKRCNRRYPFRSQLETDLKKLNFGPESRRRIAELLSNPDFAASAKRAVEAIDGVRHKLRISPRGQVTTSVTGCPRKMKPFLLLNGEPVVSCDIAHAHHCFLPAILGDRIEYLREKYWQEANTARYEAELKRLIKFLGDGDYYSKWCGNTEDPVEREEKKLLLTMILNWPNAKCKGNALYRRMRAAFPLTFRICEDIKRKHHRDISKSLQCYTARAINGALLAAQAKGIVAIPDVDAIICATGHKEAVCELIGEKVHEITYGVCCKVGGIRYLSRRLEGQSEAGPDSCDSELLSWDEEEDGGPLERDYDVWEQRRTLKTEAAMRALGRAGPKNLHA